MALTIDGSHALASSPGEGALAYVYLGLPGAVSPDQNDVGTNCAEQASLASVSTELLGMVAEQVVVQGCPAVVQ